MIVQVTHTREVVQQCKLGGERKTRKNDSIARSGTLLLYSWQLKYSLRLAHSLVCFCFQMYSLVNHVLYCESDAIFWPGLDAA